MMAKLREIEKDKTVWKANFTFVCSCLDDAETQPKAIWMIGEICFAFPELLTDSLFEQLKSFSKSTRILLCERAICAIGRIGRSNGQMVKTYIDDLLLNLQSPESTIRMNTIWASENIATAHPDFFEGRINAFIPCLYDKNERVRMEAPEIFRVIGKRQPMLAIPFAEMLEKIAQSDENRVVRLHAQGALKAMGCKKHFSE